MPKDNGYATRDKEIERLRTALVLAMADIEQFSNHPTMPYVLGRSLWRVAVRIKKELEKK